MDLYIQRHAIAVVRGTAGFERDSDRPLTDKGAKKMQRIARGMQALGLTFDCILSSPYVRARETAEIVAGVLDLNRALKFTDTLSADGDAEDLIDLLNHKYRGMNSVLLVGHEPYLSGLISLLISGGEDIPITMKKGGLCKLTVDTLRYGPCATLEWLLAPSQMVRIG